MKKEVITTMFFLNARRYLPFDGLNASSGFTVLFAVLIGSLLFSLGLFISHLSLKEISLSVAGKHSEIAFFAADTGIECALYFDRVGEMFPKSNEDESTATISCGGDLNVEVYAWLSSETAATSTFQLDFTTMNPATSLRQPSGCAMVTVGKTIFGSTVIESRGRNECGTGQNPARVERALRVRY